MKNRFISVYTGEKRILHRKKNVLAPGEMESVSLRRADIPAETGAITITIEEA